MNLIYLYVFIMQFVMITSATRQSIARSLFGDPSEDPFLNRYIETVSRMNTKEIMAIPKMDNNAFLQYLLDDDDAATRRGIRSLVDTSIFDPLRDDQLKQQTEIDKEWESLMVSGPIVVGYMSTLMVIASKIDFPFQVPNGYVFRYIRYPNSFRATLAQVSSYMYNALMHAHTAMDQIQLAMKEVPKHIKTAMKLITSASDAILKLMLPVTLESVGRLASGSADEANSTLLRFNKLQDLLAEIIELSASNQSTNEADIDRIDEQTHNAYFLIQLSEQNQLAKTMNQMAMLDLNQLSTEVILSLLIKTTEQISLIKEQWARMIQFCSKLASQAYSTKQIVVKDFVEVIQQAQNDNLLVNPFDRQFFLEIVIPSARTIESGAHLLFTMAETYYTISSEHMMNQIADIDKMLILQTDEERYAQLQQISNNALITSLKIIQLAQERYALYLQETHNRQAEYTAYINSLVTFELQGTVG